MGIETISEKIILNIGLHPDTSNFVVDMITDIMSSDLGLKTRFISASSEVIAQRLLSGNKLGRYPDLTVLTPGHLTYLRLPESRQSPIMLITAGNDKAVKELCLREQVVYMPFPFTDEEMRAALSRIFASKNTLV